MLPRHQVTSQVGRFFVVHLDTLLLGIMSVVVLFGAVWVLDHTTPYSAVWWLALIVDIPAVVFAIRFLIVLGIIYVLILIIEHFIKNPI